ncbi:MAG: bifunctional 5,10-methylenetetrahydrofolate dehydrogenase/5,10-methenyltetrahydrofolate cyclohydrolase [Acidimicrobiales bacterium]|nr:bifunctional 5,10-methylenetetrahydrofolate dehydrogenase/5,10-methenyltetrahydrofolate cyclohydrolase [Acidimicrobiales bacterium]
MTAQFLAGGPVADAVLEDVRVRALALADRGITPGLGTILVGDDEASAGYVRKKHETCLEVGVKSFHQHLPADATQADLMAAVESFNTNPEVDGFILQLPVPNGLDANEALGAIDPAKDADGLHPTNLGKLVLQQAGPRPCTPAGIQAILLHYGIEVAGKNVVIVGRGPTLGRPLSLLLTLKEPGANASVTVVHTGVPDIGAYTREAEIVVAAVGAPSCVTADMVKPGAVVVSGGISWEGRRLLPDVDEDVNEVASWVTPRLGGVGPTTVALLLRNTIEAAESGAGTG